MFTACLAQCEGCRRLCKNADPSARPERSELSQPAIVLGLLSQSLTIGCNNWLSSPRMLPSVARSFTTTASKASTLPPWSPSRATAWSRPRARRLFASPGHGGPVRRHGAPRPLRGTHEETSAQRTAHGAADSPSATDLQHHQWGARRGASHWSRTASPRGSRRPSGRARWPRAASRCSAIGQVIYARPKCEPTRRRRGAATGSTLARARRNLLGRRRRHRPDGLHDVGCGRRAGVAGYRCLSRSIHRDSSGGESSARRLCLRSIRATRRAMSRKTRVIWPATIQEAPSASPIKKTATATTARAATSSATWYGCNQDKGTTMAATASAIPANMTTTPSVISTRGDLGELVLHLPRLRLDDSAESLAEHHDARQGLAVARDRV
jgi:hypothetical protein